MKNIKLLSILAGAALLCGCASAAADHPDQHLEFVDDDVIREGYYLSSVDDSYFVIEDGRVSLVNYDWEQYYRDQMEDYDLPKDLEEGSPEYEEQIRAWAEYSNKDLTDREFTPIKFVGFETDKIMLVTNIPREEISLESGIYAGVTMPDEDTLYLHSDNLYTYYGTELPE